MVMEIYYAYIYILYIKYKLKRQLHNVNSDLPLTEVLFKLVDHSMTLNNKIEF